MNQQKRILVAVDEEARLAPLLASLHGGPHLVVVAPPEEARARLEQGQEFDLLIVDIEPPPLAGFAVIRAYRSLPVERPVLALSGAFKREHIEGMLENAGVRRLLPIDVAVGEMAFWINHALFPETMRSRRAPRIPASFSLTIAGRRRAFLGRAFNLSEDGLFLETSLEAQVGDHLELRFRLPGPKTRRETISASCEVVWANAHGEGAAGDAGPHGLGLRFTRLEERSRAAIKTYVVNSLLEVTI